MQEQIRIALPSKGRMEQETLDFLAGCGLRVHKPNPRQYTATIPALPHVLLLFQRARDIPLSVAAGDVDLGITGYDALVDTINGGCERGDRHSRGVGLWRMQAGRGRAGRLGRRADRGRSRAQSGGRATAAARDQVHRSAPNAF